MKWNISYAKKRIFVTSCISLLLLCVHTTGYGQLLRLMSKSSRSTLATTPPVAKPYYAPALADASIVPTLNPLPTGTSGNMGAVIHLTGTNFDKHTRVFFGNTEAASVSVNSSTDLDAVVGDGASGFVAVQNRKGKAQRPGFTFLPPPTISSVSPGTLSPGTVVTVIGTSLAGTTSVVIDGLTATYVAGSATPTSLTVTVAGPVTKGIVTVTTPDGVAVFPNAGDQTKTQALADLSIPDPGQGFFIVPTPTFTYNQYHALGNFGFSAKVWGNSLGTDSNLLRVGNKFLLPQTSMLGFKTEGNLRLTNRTDTNFVIGLVAEANLLLKKVSYFDTSKKSTTSFNPYVIHPRVGFLVGFFNDDVYVGGYWNFLCVVSENQAFGDFFHTGAKNVFAFPEVTVGGVFDLDKGAKQAMRFELDMIINNGDASSIYGSRNTLIPNLKIGFITRL